MQQFLSEAQSGKVTDYLEQEVLEGIREEYGEFVKQQEIGLAAALRKIYVRTGRGMSILKASERLLQDTLQCDEKRVAEGLDAAHMEGASILQYNDENSLSCAIGLAYYSARREYRLIRELPMGRGFADIIFLPLPGAGKPALVVELKYDKTAGATIEQIKERKYTKALEGYTGEMLLVGINYDKKQKTHSCRIEKFDLH